ncbi:MAG: hypothetical protein NC907_00665 [Candidatus Omnitrophica bacterium]|nr:hypothetical protein [Candidatus Omnitrophota bacterium]
MNTQGLEPLELTGYLFSPYSSQYNSHSESDKVRKIVSAYDGRGNKIDFVQNGNRVIFSRSIDENDGDICVFKW